jgi:hypothetical protein
LHLEDTYESHRKELGLKPIAGFKANRNIIDRQRMLRILMPIGIIIIIIYKESTNNNSAATAARAAADHSLRR